MFVFTYLWKAALSWSFKCHVFFCNFGSYSGQFFNLKRYNNFIFELPRHIRFGTITVIMELVEFMGFPSKRWAVSVPRPSIIYFSSNSIWYCTKTFWVYTTAHCIYWYISVHSARKDLTAQIRSTLGKKNYPNWNELEERAEMILDLTKNGS